MERKSDEEGFPNQLLTWFGWLRRPAATTKPSHLIKISQFLIWQIQFAIWDKYNYQFGTNTVCNLGQIHFAYILHIRQIYFAWWTNIIFWIKISCKCIFYKYNFHFGQSTSYLIPIPWVTTKPEQFIKISRFSILPSQSI